MGLLGSLLYPDDPKMEKDLNDKQLELQHKNNLHNDLVNSYRAIGESTKTFDAYFMALTVMDYHLVYITKDLSDLPETKNPKIQAYWADKIESVAINALTAKMAVDGFKAIGNGISNLAKRIGTYKKATNEGVEESEIAEDLGAEVESTALKETMLESGEVDMLTVEVDSDAGGLASELKSSAQEVSETLEEEGELSENLESISETADSAEEGAAMAEEGAAASGLLSTAMAALGPVLLVVTVVTEIISAIHEGQTHAKLKEAESKMDDLLSKMDTSLTTMKKVFTKLLKAAKKDIENYNKILPQVAIMQGDPALNHSFSTGGLDAYISGMKGITISSTNNVSGFQVAALQNLTEATNFIREHASSTSQMTNVVKQIRTHMSQNNPILKDLKDDDPFLSAVANVDSIELATVQAYNKYRRFLNTYASYLLPYHERVKEDSKGKKVPVVPPTVPVNSKPDPDYVPKPSTIP